MMRMALDTRSVDDYAKFLQIKALPRYEFCGNTALFPDEYAAMIGCDVAESEHVDYEPESPDLFDYQRDIAKLAIRRRKFSVFADCGLGKTLILAEFARHAARVLPPGKCVLIVSPLMVIDQTLGEIYKFYGADPLLEAEQVRAAGLNDWLASGSGRIGITNYDALTDDIERGRIGALILDESSMLKSHYGKWAGVCLRLGAGLEWKLACTGTPAPNDRIEYANHAVLVDAFPTVNSFLARFFVNRGQTGERWELKRHALRPFYRALSHWCIFLSDPSVYGWKDNTEPLPPIHVNVESVDMTAAQREAVHSETGHLFVTNGTIGGITSRSVLSQIAKGNYRGKPIETNKPKFIADMLKRWPDESTIVWCRYNAEQASLAKFMPDAASISGDTPHSERQKIIDDFKAGRIKTIITKPKILGFGLNLEVATRQVFSGLQDSYEEYYQAVKRSNRYGATRPLNVHIPVTEIERPMIETVMRKAKMIERDTREQERLFKEIGYAARG